MALGLPNTSTVPRKRRPRAVGEVFISSSSRLYLVDRHGQAASGTSSAIEEPFYENTAPDESVASDASGPLVDPKGRVLYLSVVRVRQPEIPELIPDSGEELVVARPDVPPRRKNRAEKSAVKSGAFECQVVSAFVGELWDVYVSRRQLDAVLLGMLHKRA